MTKECTCIIHRYHVAHLCSCGQVFSHGQADCDQHVRCLDEGGEVNFDPDLYVHGENNSFVSLMEAVLAKKGGPENLVGYNPLAAYRTYLQMKGVE